MVSWVNNINTLMKRFENHEIGFRISKQFTSWFPLKFMWFPTNA